ncbi:probable ascorbate-specific transmembrane electron transporter 2 [Lolium rigidum]|uniref:probable ascorbate-specific transmembrane electron transporter 2 n=1 Tax=Lolium rigidum TaxID=89674 RepID=UPI001F5C73CD|nr:probable ascorbate-specific transmembrane electron transporter 2 [Lolium rigidum]
MAIGGIIGSHQRHSVVASRVAMFAHLLFLVTAVLMLVWLLRFRGGINIQSEDPDQIFNVHPFVMSWGFILLIGEAILVYTTVPMNHRAQKMVHMLVHMVAFILGVFGVYAAFKFHNAAVAPDLVSLHSWIGIGAISLFALQWLIGFAVFWMPGTHEHTRAAAAPLHVAGGLAVFLLAVCAAQTGLVQKGASATPGGTEANLINVTGVFILFYGATVAATVVLRMATRHV